MLACPGPGVPGLADGAGGCGAGGIHSARSVLSPTQGQEGHNRGQRGRSASSLCIPPDFPDSKRIKGRWSQRLPCQHPSVRLWGRALIATQVPRAGSSPDPAARRCPPQPCCPAERGCRCLPRGVWMCVWGGAPPCPQLRAHHNRFCQRCHVCAASGPSTRPMKAGSIVLCEAAVNVHCALGHVSFPGVLHAASLLVRAGSSSRKKDLT